MLLGLVFLSASKRFGPRAAVSPSALALCASGKKCQKGWRDEGVKVPEIRLQCLSFSKWETLLVEGLAREYYLQQRP